MQAAKLASATIARNTIATIVSALILFDASRVADAAADKLPVGGAKTSDGLPPGEPVKRLLSVAEVIDNLAVRSLLVARSSSDAVISPDHKKACDARIGLL
jgi:hypothetical protein